MSETLLDARGLNCPLPILKTRKALKDMALGDALRVLATDPGALEDFPAFCRTTGHELVETSQDGATYSFVIKRGV
ncbi:MAG TPA: sulfurtransferase TusA family protein [Roseiarcus sp.]|nr:sulfurtransferase TusA family protein [Roseiarcus sp.]